MAEDATIFALSSGAAPAAIGVIRISGSQARTAIARLAGRVPEPRRASLAWLRDPENALPLDRGLILWFPGPRTATGEDLAELHIHGGRAVAEAVLAALGRIAGLRPAMAGEFTRRAFTNGVIDLAEAEGLADLLAAETESQRRAALASAGGMLSRQVERWRERLLALSAMIEARLDFADEGDVEDDVAPVHTGLHALAAEIAAALHLPYAERLRDGIRVVLAGPPNAGKSTLLNALVGRDAAIVSNIAGTTRDVIEVPAAIDGVAFLFSDTAGLREAGDEIEAIGIARAAAAIDQADIVLWLGPAEAAPDAAHIITVAAKADLGNTAPVADIPVSALTGEGLAALLDRVVATARTLLPGDGEVSVNRRQRDALQRCATALHNVVGLSDLIVIAEEARLARAALDEVIGRAGVEDMLDALFGRFCIGK